MEDTAMQQKEYLKTEFIGKTVIIRHCTDPTWINKSGIIIDETQKTFSINLQGTAKRIAKNIATFEFNLEGKKIMIEGSRIQYRPEDRIKKAR
jgi:ribonuclease P protein subunit POP4